jgi:hypothetical protein
MAGDGHRAHVERLQAEPDTARSAAPGQATAISGAIKQPRWDRQGGRESDRRWPRSADHTARPLLRHGMSVKVEAAQVNEPVRLLNRDRPDGNHFAIAEAVILKGGQARRPGHRAADLRDTLGPELCEHGSPGADPSRRCPAPRWSSCCWRPLSSSSIWCGSGPAA